MQAKPVPAETGPSTFASRRADRDARIAAGEQVEPPRNPNRGFRAGADAENPTLTVLHVRA